MHDWHAAQSSTEPRGLDSSRREVDSVRRIWAFYWNLGGRADAGGGRCILEAIENKRNASRRS
jgi:hypothetical protein